MYLQNTLTNNDTSLLTYFDYEEIVSLYTQPSLLVIELLSHIFNITINVHYPKGQSNYFDCLQVSNGTLKIELCYLKGSYHVFYVNDTNVMQQQHDNCLRFHLIENSKLTCIHCNNLTQYIQFNYNDNNTYYCYSCLYNYINQGMEQRAKLFVEHNYLHQELFTSQIPLAYDINITDTEVFYCFKETLSDLLLHNINVNCSICKEVFNKKDIVSLECSCLYCNMCLNKFIQSRLHQTFAKQITKEHIGTVNMQCQNCNECVDIHNYVHYSDEIFQKYESIKKDFFTTHCCLCGVIMQNNKGVIWNLNESNDDSKITYKTLQVHLLCMKCSKALYPKKQNKICLMCRIYHYFAEPTQKPNAKQKKCKCAII